MTPAEVLAQFRIEVQDQAEPYLWSDVELYRYMTEAQEMFCRLGGGIADSTTASIVEIEATISEEFSDISPKILKIRQARRAEDNRVIDIINFEDFERPSLITDYGHSVTYNMDDTEGELQIMVTGMEQDKVRWYHIPAETQTVKLIVYRLPLYDDITGQTIEIHSQHHMELIHWMKYRAYCKQDAEAYDRSKADDFKARFLESCDMAKREREKREHKPRAVVYGGI